MVLVHLVLHHFEYITQFNLYTPNRLVAKFGTHLSANKGHSTLRQLDHRENLSLKWVEDMLDDINSTSDYSFASTSWTTPATQPTSLEPKNLQENQILINNHHDFLKIADSSLYVISGFFDLRYELIDDSPKTVIFGLFRKYDNHKFYCHFWNEFRIPIHSSLAKIQFLPELQTQFIKLRYRLVMIKCPGNLEAKYFTLSPEKSVSNSKMEIIPIQTIRFNEKPPDGKLGLCVKPLYNYQDIDVGKLIEFIEFYRLVGVEKFFIYDTYNCSKNVDDCLRVYQNMGVVEIVPWQLPMMSEVKAAGSFTVS